MVRYSLSLVVVWGSLACGATTPPPPASIPATPKPDEATIAANAQERVALCSTTINVRDQPFCVRKLTTEQQRRRNWSRRLTYQDGRVVSMETINGRGRPYSDDPDEVCSFREYTYKDGKPAGGSCRDARGIVRRHYEISSDGATHYALDAWKRPVSRPESRWVAIRRVFDREGRVVSHTYLDRQGRPVPDKKGVCRFDFVYDVSGAVLHERHYDDLGEPMLDKDGVHHVATVPNSWGGSVEERYFGTQEEPLLNRNGVHLLRFGFNDFGQSIEASRFDLADEPVIDSQIDASVWRAQRNEYGETVENYYYDTEGEPTTNDWHYFFNRESYDAAGRRTERGFFDVDGQPQASKGGNFTWRWNYDDTGVLLGSDYLDGSGQPILARTYASERFTYDDRFNVLRRQTLGTDGKPIDNWNRYATIVHEYDEFDQRVQSETFDATGERVDSSDGFARMKAEFAPDGRLISRRYFDARGTEVARGRLAVIRVSFTEDQGLLKVHEEVRRRIEATLRSKLRARSEAQERANLAREALSSDRPAEVVIAHFGDRPTFGRPSSYDVETFEKLPTPLREAALGLGENQVSAVLEDRENFWVLRYDPDF